MSEKIKQYKKMIALAYGILIVFFMPLYMRDGYVMIGDVKYVFYRNISFLFVIISAIVGIAGFSGHIQKRKPQFSSTDICVLGFAAVSCLSWLFSDYKEIAFWGYDGWNMGLMTQLMLVFGYFLISRWLDEPRTIFICMGAACFIVSLIGIINRFGYDPLYVFQDMSWWDWNRRNLLSTIGNINWLCSYLAAAAPVLIYFCWSSNGIYRCAAIPGAFIVISLMMIQGSSSAYPALAVMLVILFCFSLGNLDRLICFFDVILLIPLFWTIMTALDMALLLPYEVDIEGTFYSQLWIALFLLIVILDAAFRVARKYYYKSMNKVFFESGRVKKTARLLLLGILAVGAVCLCLCQISDVIWNYFGGFSILRFNDEWGSFRGILWKKALQGFAEADIVTKLYGAGPDCFALYMYENVDMNIISSGQWSESIYANAHNEWFTMLINEGILGALTYIGIFVSGIKNAIRNIKRNELCAIVAMAAAAYAVNNFVSFQQAVSTPLIFIVAALGENICRRSCSGIEKEEMADGC